MYGLNDGLMGPTHGRLKDAVRLYGVRTDEEVFKLVGVLEGYPAGHPVHELLRLAIFELRRQQVWEDEQA